MQIMLPSEKSPISRTGLVQADLVPQITLLMTTIAFAQSEQPMRRLKDDPRFGLTATTTAAIIMGHELKHDKLLASARLLHYNSSSCIMLYYVVYGNCTVLKID